MTREQRIRALAGQWLMWRDPHPKPDSLWREQAQSALLRATACIDAIDALPVPGEAKCGDCDGDGSWPNDTDGTSACLTCNGTGKASTNDDG